MNNFKKIDQTKLLQSLEPPKGRISMVLDTDAYNEIDDQFAIVYSLLSREKLNVEAIYAAPFLNNRSESPGDGMEKSYDEILRLLERLGVDHENLVYKGSDSYLPAPDRPVNSQAVDDLIERAMSDRNDILYVVAIGAITNIASAIIKKPEIIEKIVVLWLGGHPLEWRTAKEFNLQQDIHASQLMFNCGVPLVLVPCKNVAEHLIVSPAELHKHIYGHSKIGDYLYDSFASYNEDHYAWTKEIWDIAPIAWLLHPEWAPSSIVHSPILTDQLTWSSDSSRHFIRVVNDIKRDRVFRDLFTKLEEFAAGKIKL